MAYIGNEEVDACIREIIDKVIEPRTGVLNFGQYKSTEQDLKSLVGAYLGIRTEDGEQRVYDVSLIEGEPYVYDA